MWRFSWILLLAVNLEASVPSDIIPCFDNGKFNEVLEINDTSVRIPLRSINPIQDDDTTQYIVEYSHVKHLGCSDNQATINTNITHADGIETEIILDDLMPFSLYNMTLWEMGKNKTCIGKGTFNTTESDMLGDDEKPIITHILNGTEVVVTIRWPCEYLLGRIFHKIVVSCVSQSCVRETFEYVEVVNVSSVIAKFPAAKQTKYLVKLTYWRGDDSRSEEYDIFVNVREPNKVGDLKIYAANETAVSLRWLPPGSNTGQIEFYEIEYSLYGNNDVKSIKVDILSHNCTIWNQYICYTIYDNLFLNNSYSFEVRAKNILVNKPGLFQIATLDIERERVPSPPLNLRYHLNDDGILTINWQHSDVPNGPIFRYHIGINNAIVFTYNVTLEHLDYTYDINMNMYNLTLEKILIEISAENKFGNSRKSSTWNVEPHFSEDPTAGNETDSTFDIEFSPVVDVEGDTSKMYVVVTDPYLLVQRDDLHPREEELFRTIDVNTNYSWTIGEFDLRNIPDNLTVGDDTEAISELDSTWKFWNRKLDSDQEYNVTIVLNDTLFTTTKLRTYDLNGRTIAAQFAREPENGNTNYLWSLLLIPASLGIVYAAFMSGVQRRRRTLISKILFCGFWDDYNNPQIYSSYTSRPKINDGCDISLDEQNFTKMVKIQELDYYIKSSTENYELMTQYELFPRSPHKSHYDGSMIQNRAKNRFPTLIAYDDTRVKLEVIDDDPFSDYINANYIDGYSKPKAYIATQTPTYNTYSDFWRMIWQEDVKHIIVAADVTQQDEYQSSGKYWPEMSECLDFGDIKVEYDNVEVMPNYVVRHLSLFCNHERRQVQQLHFFGEPDYTRVPLYIHSLASFVKKILSLPEEESPIVVHCSDGITHTGIVILSVICLRMAISEGQIDILNNLCRLRNQRMNMVNSAEQYKVVHFVLLRILECLKIPTETGVVCDRTMDATIINILETKIPHQMKYLEESTWQDDAMNDIDLIYDCINKGSQVPIFAQLHDEPSQKQLYHYDKIGDSQLFIATTIVDSFTIPSRFVVTAKPLTATLGIFWQFIYDRQINVIVSLNKLALIADFEDTFNPSPTLEVTCISRKQNEYFEVYTVHTNVTNNKDAKSEVKIIHILGWSSDVIHPETPNSLIMAYEEMNRLGVNGGSILITCHDGIQASGLFLAMCFLIEKIRMEHICDVCLAVKSVRQSRKDYVKKVEQFMFLYLCALEYVRKFNMYANFDAPVND